MQIHNLFFQEVSRIHFVKRSELEKFNKRINYQNIFYPKVLIQLQIVTHIVFVANVQQCKLEKLD